MPIQDVCSYYQMKAQNMINSQPIIIDNPEEEVPQSPSINNQPIDSEIKFGKKTQKMKCPHCHQKMSTNIEDECNCASFVVYMFMIIIFPIFFFTSLV